MTTGGHDEHEHEHDGEAHELEDEAAVRGDPRSGAIGDAVRRALLGGLSAVLTTEEGIRNLVGELRLPKDVIALLTQQAERSRKEAFRMAADEVGRFLAGVDVARVVRKALVGMKVEVKAELRFLDDDGAPAAEKVRVQVTPAATASTPSAASTRKTPRRRTATDYEYGDDE